MEITDEVCHRCEAATLARHEAATPQAWKAATVCTGGLQLCVRQVRALALRVLSECDPATSAARSTARSCGGYARLRRVSTVPLISGMVVRT